MFGDHLKEIRGIMDTKRYHNKFQHRARSVAEHSWFVCKVAHGLAIWEKDKFKTDNVDIGHVLFIAINHDIVEAYTGDIISTTKNLSTLFRSELDKEEERILTEHVPQTLPKSWGEDYRKLHYELSELKTIESKIVKAADIIDRLYECLEEIELGNKNPYEEILISDIQRLFDMNMMSVNYFLKYAIKDIKGYIYVPKEIKIELEGMDFSEYF